MLRVCFHNLGNVFTSRRLCNTSADSWAQFCSSVPVLLYLSHGKLNLPLFPLPLAPQNSHESPAPNNHTVTSEQTKIVSNGAISSYPRDDQIYRNELSCLRPSHNKQNSFRERQKHGDHLKEEGGAEKRRRRHQVILGAAVCVHVCVCSVNATKPLLLRILAESEEDA